MLCLCYVIPTAHQREPEAIILGCIVQVIFFAGNLHTVCHEISLSLCFWARDLLIDKFYQNLSNDRSGAQKQRLNEIYEQFDLTKNVQESLIILYI